MSEAEETTGIEEEEVEVTEMALTDNVVRAIRTYVPILAGTLIGLILKHFHIDLSGLGLENAIVPMAIAGWWSLWALLEKKWRWLGWLNGHPKNPKPEEEEEEEEPAPIIVADPTADQLMGVINNLSKVVSDVADLIKQLPEKRTVGWKSSVSFEAWPPEVWPPPVQFEVWPPGCLPSGTIWQLPGPPAVEGEPEVKIEETSTFLEATPDPEEESGYSIREIREVDDQS